MLKNKMWHSYFWEKKRKALTHYVFHTKELINFFSPYLKVPKWVWNFRKCQEAMQSVTMELKKKPEENKAYEKLCQQLAVLLS